MVGEFFRAMRRVSKCLAVAVPLLMIGLAAVPWPSGAIVPAPLPEPLAPAGNPGSVARVQLGRMLFFDPLLSRNQRVACATCHDPKHAFADPRGFSVGVTGEALPRNTPSVANLAYSGALFWDGRAGSLEEQAIEPLMAHDEMAADVTVLLEQLRSNTEYAAMFDAAFPQSGVSLVNLARAIAAYERTLVVRDTPYDRWAAGDEAAVSDSAKRGFDLFFGKASRAEKRRSRTRFRRWRRDCQKHTSGPAWESRRPTG
jgi:cytochrome c peroxidase